MASDSENDDVFNRLRDEHEEADSESSSNDAEIGRRNDAEAATENTENKQSTTKFLSFDDALKTAVLEFKNFNDEYVSHLEHNENLDDGFGKSAKNYARVMAVSSGTAETDNIPSADHVGLPAASWHVPLTTLHILDEERGKKEKAQKRIQIEPDSQDKTSESTEFEDESKQKMTVKEKERLKRFKGQSSHKEWKPELWMQLRQQFD